MRGIMSARGSAERIPGRGWSLLRSGREAPVTNGWTGGQYSLYRAILGTFLAAQFARFLARLIELARSEDGLPLLGSPSWTMAVVLLAGMAGSVLLAVGLRDRVAAIVAPAAWITVHLSAPNLFHHPLAAVWILLVAHALLPPAPFGSIEARGRIDPAGGWSMPTRILSAVWILLGLVYGAIGVVLLVGRASLDVSDFRHALLTLPDPLRRAMTWSVAGAMLLFGGLVLIRKTRALAWGVLCLILLGTIALTRFDSTALGMVALLLFTFDPAWVRSRGEGPSVVFYDGSCGLCHGAVRFLLAEDRSQAFRFAPLQSEAFLAAIPEERRRTIPDSIVVLTEKDELLLRSDAVVYLLRRLGGMWRVLGEALARVPGGVRDLGYDGIARVRKRIFPPPPEACPRMPKELRTRFGVRG